MELFPSALAEAVFPCLGQDELFEILRSMSLVEALRLSSVSSTFSHTAKAIQQEAEELQLSSTCDALGDDLFVRLLSKSPKLKRLKIRGCDMLSSDCALAAIARYMSLESLELSQTQLDAASFALLWCSLPHLVALDVDRCDELESRELDRYLSDTTTKRRLHTLSIASCLRLSAATVSRLSQSCADSLTDLDASGYDELGAEEILMIATACPNLRRLRLVESERFDDDACLHLASLCPNLTALDFSWCEEPSGDGLTELARACPQLRECELRCCSQASAVRLLTVLGRSCPELCALNLNRCGDEPEPALPSHPEFWDEVNAGRLALPRRFTTLGYELSAGCMFLLPLARRCERLQWLDVGWLAELIDDSACAMLLTALPRLSVLSVEGCKQLTDEALAPLLPGDVVQLSDASDAARNQAPPLAADDDPKQCGVSLLRLNCSWVDRISNKTLHAVLSAHAERRRHVLASQIEDRLVAALRRGELHSQGPPELSQVEHPPAQLLCLDYYGACWGLGADGKPSQTKLRGVPPLRPDGPSAMSGWVAAFNGGAFNGEWSEED